MRSSNDCAAHNSTVNTGKPRGSCPRRHPIRLPREQALMYRFRSILFSPLAERRTTPRRPDASRPRCPQRRPSRCTAHSPNRQGCNERCTARTTSTRFKRPNAKPWRRTPRCIPEDADIEVETTTTIGSPSLSIIEQVLRASTTWWSSPPTRTTKTTQRSTGCSASVPARCG